ncbi:MAG: catalase [Desulfovibrio sp.]|nr:catalase [Desulfovibrio sp.]
MTAIDERQSTLLATGAPLSPAGNTIRSAGNSSRTSSQNGNAQSFADRLSLTPEAEQELKELQQRDQEVRHHEEAHKAAAGPYSEGVSYDLTTGPDGKQYAVGGSCAIDTSPVPGDPEATLRKAQQIKRAAKAPAEPSSQDMKVASEANQLENNAREDLAEEKREDGNDASPLGGTESFVRSALNTQDLRSGDSQSGTPLSLSWSQGVYHVGRTAHDHTFSVVQNSGTGYGFPTAEVSSSRIAQASHSYAVMSRQGVMPTALAPNGTGISLHI